ENIKVDFDLADLKLLIILMVGSVIVCLGGGKNHIFKMNGYATCTGTLIFLFNKLSQLNGARKPFCSDERGNGRWRRGRRGGGCRGHSGHRSRSCGGCRRGCRDCLSQYRRGEYRNEKQYAIRFHKLSFI